MMKKKWMAPLLALMLCVSMVGVGFAAWIITAPTEGSANGQFEVYAVENNSVDMDVAITGDDIVFGKAASLEATATHNWLTLSDNVNENLTRNMTVTINNWEQIKTKTITLSLSAMKIMVDDNWNDNVAGTDKTADYTDYITLPFATADDIVITNGQVTDNAGVTGVAVSAEGVVTIPLNFGWGEAFGKKNPLNFFNSVSPNTILPSGNPGQDTDNSVTYLQHAEDALAKVYTLNNTTGNDIRYTITVTATVAAN